MFFNHPSQNHRNDGREKTTSVYPSMPITASAFQAYGTIRRDIRIIPEDFGKCRNQIYQDQPFRGRRVGKWRASVARCPPNRAYRQLSGSGVLNIVVGTYANSPITVVQCRTQLSPLPRTSILFRPHITHQPTLKRGLMATGTSARDEWWNLVEAPGTAPGSVTIIPTKV